MGGGNVSEPVDTRIVAVAA